MSTIYKPVESFFDKFFATTKRPGLALLGNFGSGKTSLCKHYAYLLATRWDNRSATTPLPIYIDLREFRNFLNLEADILRLLRAEYQARVNERGWRYWLANRPTLILLDGFDEMATPMDRLDINRNVSILRGFSGTNQVKFLLSCRTHFFKTQIEETSLGDVLRLYLRDWGAEELTEYVTKASPQDIETSLRIIKSTYNLEELARTPIFLNMITATLEAIPGTVNRARLYQVYTDRWVQYQEGRSKLSSGDKELLMEGFAFEMFLTGLPRISHELLPAKIKEFLSLNDHEKVIELDRDVRTCTFLIRDPVGHYHFVHKSFMEFFVAHKLAKEVKSGVLDNFSRRELTPEIAGFFANYFEDEMELLIRHLVGHYSDTTRANCALSLGMLGDRQNVIQALLLSLSTERSSVVKQSAVDALIFLNRPETIAEIVRLAREPGELGVYCLRKLSTVDATAGVLALYQAILMANSDREATCVTLANVAEIRQAELLVPLKQVIKSKVWVGDAEMTMALIGAIRTTSDLELALCVSLIEDAWRGSQEITNLIASATHDLGLRFEARMTAEAEAHKRDRISYSKSEGILRRSYGPLIEEEHLRTILAGVYEGGGRRRGASSRKRRH